jgi:hypothetical protein
MRRGWNAEGSLEVVPVICDWTGEEPEGLTSGQAGAQQSAPYIGFGIGGPPPGCVLRKDVILRMLQARWV